jgi:transcriptional regulator with XRE-family HTH domain
MILKGGTHDMKLGQTILDIRKERKMTQEEFAQIFHVTRQTVSNWEKEKNYPDLETLIFMSDEFNISLDVMLKEDKKMVKKLNKAYSSKAFAKALKGVSKESRDADVAALNEIIEISMKLKNIIESID